MPEQIQLHGPSTTPAALIDPWGRPHRLSQRTLVGRQVDGQGLAILESSVSRHHAELTFDGTAWTVRDLGSANGTYAGDRVIDAPLAVKDGDRIRFGQIAFYFTADVATLPQPLLSRTATIRSDPRFHTKKVEVIANDVDDALETTLVGLPTLEFKLHEPTGGGGGLIEVDGKQVQLTTTQFELMSLMIKRMATESHQPEIVRGFVRSSELIADLSWDTREPSENHVKQLIRRVRRALIKSEIGDLIESRHRFGYRLRAIPRTTT
ncbi:MAG: FHA domain-containing protein [Kofleriaceae bacterium]